MKELEVPFLRPADILCVSSPQQKDVKDVFTAITFEAAYSLGRHVETGRPDQDLPELTPVLRWRKGRRIAARNEVPAGERSVSWCRDSFQMNVAAC